MVEFNFLQAPCEQQNPKKLETSEALEFLLGILQEYAHVFEMPVGLPPKRSHDHAVVLQEGVNPVNVRPYRYPQIQKKEIEKLIKDML